MLRSSLMWVACLMVAASGLAAPPVVWETRGPGGGGALYSPSWSPHNVDELYLGCDMSDLFHTTDAGRGWNLVDYRVLQGNRGSRMQYTTDPLVLFVIDYTSLNGTDWSRPVKSVDGGATWTPLPGDPTGGFVWGLWVDPADPTRIMVTDWNTLYFSSNGGTSFQQKHLALDNNSGVHVAGVFFDGADIFVGTNDGLLVSGNGGTTFTMSAVPGIPNTESMVSFAGAKVGTTTRFFAVTGPKGSIYGGIGGEDHWSYVSVYVIDWGAASWVARTNGIRNGDHPWFCGMARNDIGTAFLGGGNDVGVPTVYRTTDGGATWENVFGCTGNTNIVTGWSGYQGDMDWWWGETALGFGVSLVDANRVAISDYGFIHVTTDGGATWRQAYVDASGENPAGASTPKGRAYRSIGLEQTSVWSLAWADAQHLFGGYTDIRGSISNDGGLSWGFGYSGHDENTMYRVVRHPSGTLYAATSSVHDLYQSTYLTDGRIDGGRGRVLYSADMGATWLTLHDFGHPVVWVATDPTDANRLYASVVHSAEGGIYLSSDIQNGGASTWTHLPDPPRTEGHPFNIVVLGDGTVVTTFSGRRDTTNHFTDSSGVFVSMDHGLNWRDASSSEMHYWTKDVVVDPHDAGQATWYVGVYSHWNGPAPNERGGLYRTRDRGLTWTRLIDMEGVESITIDPVNADQAYLTTQVRGLQYTEDLNAPTPTWAETTYPFRQPERVFFNPYDPTEIWVGSFGGGVRVGKTGAADSLLRNADVATLTPAINPGLNTIFPLDAADAWQPLGAPGDLDHDANVVTNPAMPLVFYGMTRTGVLQLVKTPARRVAIYF